MGKFATRKRTTVRLVAGLAAAFTLTAGIVTPANSAPMAPVAVSAERSGSADADAPTTRASTYVGGGYWQYGTTSSTVYSKYQHASRSHHSTACTKDRLCARSGWKNPGVLATAARSKSKGGNTAFWDVG